MGEKKSLSEKRKEAGRKGGLKKKGKKTAKTLEREIVQNEIQQRVLRSHGVILDSQMSLAKGNNMLFVIKSHMEGKKRVQGKPILVEDRATIEAYLAGELEDEEDEYYFITTKVPDNNAIKDLWDRTFGKPKETIDMKHTGFSLKELYDAAKE